MEEATHTSRAALRPETAVMVKISAGLDCEAVSTLVRGCARVCKFHATDYGMNTCMVHSRGFGCAAGFRTFQLRVQEGATTSALATSHPDSVTQSLLQRLWTGDEMECVQQDNRMCAV